MVSLRLNFYKQICAGTIAAIAAIALLYSPLQVEAQTAWSINRVHTIVSVADTGSATITEDIRVDFADSQRTGFTRSIPLQYKQGNKTWFVKVEDVSVQRNKADEPFSVQSLQDVLVVNIGDERLTLKGEQRYTITYQVEGIVQRHTQDCIYWSTAGDFDIQVNQSTAELQLPENGLQDASCTILGGNSSQDHECQAVKLSDKVARYSATKPLNRQQTMAIAAKLSPDSVPLTVVQPPSVADWFIVYRQPLLILGSISALSLLLASGLWLHKRRVDQAAQDKSIDSQ